MCVSECFEAVQSWTLMSHTLKNFNSFRLRSQNLSSHRLAVLNIVTINAKNTEKRKIQQKSVSQKHTCLLVFAFFLLEGFTCSLFFICLGAFSSIEEIPENIVHDHEKNGLPRLSSFSDSEIKKR